MAKTLTVASALNILNIRFPRLLVDGIGARFADEVIGYMWTRYPWKESLAELPPFHLTRDESDYAAPLLAVPSDFFGLHDARLRNSSNYVSAPLTIQKELRYDGVPGLPTSIAYQKDIAGFRVHPVPQVGGADWWVEGTYKKTPTKVTNENLAAYTLPWDDIYFAVFRAGMVAKIKDELMQDTNAALLAFQRFNGDLQRMAMDEGVHEGVTIISPSDALAYGG
jgi:hypothetical protein